VSSSQDFGSDDASQTVAPGQICRASTPACAGGTDAGGMPGSGQGSRLYKQHKVWTVEDESDLRQFLKVVRPDWSCARRKGHSNIQRVVEKLKAVGVYDTWELMHRVNANTINEDLSAAGCSRFSRDTLESIRKQSSFVRALEHLKEPYYRQIGLFAPVPQLLTGTNLRVRAAQSGYAASGAAVVAPVWPATPERSAMLERSASESSSLPAGGGGGAGRGGGSRGAVRVHLGDELESVDGERLHTVAGATCGGPDSLFLGCLESGISQELSGFPCHGNRRSLDGSLSRHLYLRGARRPRHSKPRDIRTQSSVMSTSSSLPELSKELFSHDAFDLNSARATSPSERSNRSNSPPRSRANTAGSVGTDCRGAVSNSRVCSPARNRRGSGDSSFGSSHGREPRVSPSQVKAQSTADAELQLEAQAEKWEKSGVKMLNERRDARWTSLCSDSLLLHGDAMLLEQVALDDRTKLYRLMQGQGPASGMRRHIANNIKCRLREESERDTQMALDTQQRCMNIRKNLTSMLNARRELNAIRTKAQVVIEGEEEPKKNEVGLSLELFHRSKSLTQRALDVDTISSGMPKAMKGGKAAEDPAKAGQYHEQQVVSSNETSKRLHQPPQQAGGMSEATKRMMKTSFENSKVLAAAAVVTPVIKVTEPPDEGGLLACRPFELLQATSTLQAWPGHGVPSNRPSPRA